MGKGVILAGVVFVVGFLVYYWVSTGYIREARDRATELYYNTPHVDKNCTVIEVRNRVTVSTLECGELHVHKNVGRSLEIGVTYTVETYSGIGINWREIDATGT